MTLSFAAPIGFIFDAIDQKDHDLVERLAPSLPLNYRDSEGFTPLMRAAKIGDARSVEFLLPWSDPLAFLEAPGSEAEKAVLSKAAVSQGSAIAMAAAAGHADCVRLLFPSLPRWGGDFVDMHRNTPLGLATVAGHVDCVRFLARKHSNALYTKNEQGHTPLLSAVSSGRSACVAELADQSPLRAVNSWGYTATMLAAHEQDLESLKILAPLSDMSDAPSFPWRTPLLAILHSPLVPVNAECVSVILLHTDDKALKLTAKPDDRTALTLAVEESHSPRVVELIARRWDLSALDSQGRTAWDVVLAHAARFTFRPSFFGCADALSAFYPDEETLPLIDLCPPEIREQRLPRLIALREAAALKQAIARMPSGSAPASRAARAPATPSGRRI